MTSFVPFEVGFPLRLCLFPCLLSARVNRELGSALFRVDSISAGKEGKGEGGLYVYPSDYVRRRSLDLLALQAWATLKRHLSPAGICQAVFAEGISRLLTDRTKTNRVWEALHFLVHVFCLSLSFFFFFSSLHVVNALGTSGSTRGAPSPCERSVSTRGCAANG